MANTMQRRSNLELLKLVMTMRQKYEATRDKWRRTGKEWTVPPKVKKAIKVLADIYVRFNEKRFWHTDDELPALHDLAEFLVQRHAELSNSRANEALARMGVLDPKAFTGEANQGDLWLLWHAELEGQAREEFLLQQRFEDN